jgi:hypothetical protein
MPAVKRVEVARPLVALVQRHGGEARLFEVENAAGLEVEHARLSLQAPNVVLDVECTGGSVAAIVISRFRSFRNGAATIAAPSMERVEVPRPPMALVQRYGREARLFEIVDLAISEIDCGLKCITLIIGN